MYPIELSGGMKQRVVMVLSTLLNPSLLIADEITSALDVSTQKAVAETLVEFRDRGFVKSMIVITHDISILYQIADTILVMYAGQAGREGVRGADRLGAAPPVHAAPGLVAAGSGRALSGEAALRHRGPPAVLARSATGCRFRDRCPLATERCLEEPPFVDVGARAIAGTPAGRPATRRC